MTQCDWLISLYKNKKLRAIDLQFARFIATQLDDPHHALIGWAALTSFELGKGNVCVDLAHLDTASLFDLAYKEAKQACQRLNVANVEVLLSSSSLVDLSADEHLATPFVFTQRRLYLRRYWQAEKQVAHEILRRTDIVALPDNTRDLLDELFTPDVGLLKNILSGCAENDKPEKFTDFFDVVKPELIDVAAGVASVTPDALPNTILRHVPDAARLNWQKVAAAVALSYRFSVISGGPGTGKTTTVAKLLAALVSTHQGEQNLEIKLVAPTGKAANRLTESIGKAVESLPVDKAIRQKIPVLASTIHRLLGAIPQRVGFRHHADNRLHLDILVVDEASMVDLLLMSRLLSALPDHARVILLGDRDQLASVEGGAVLGDICIGANQGYSPTRASGLTALTGFELPSSKAASLMSDGVCLLRKSYRFHAKSGVGQLAKIINNGETKSLSAIWLAGFSDIRWHPLKDTVYEQAIAQTVEGYSSYLKAIKAGADHREILNKFNQIRMLCALTEGPYGIAGLNRAIETLLVKKALINMGTDRFYAGRPVMVTQNDHGLGLYNGDIGIVLDTDEGRRVVFELSDGSIKPFLPSRLPDHQTAYAMTIHKSQGSEFAHTILIFPTAPCPVMNRELVYTGVTRAKNQLDVYATEASLINAIERKTERFSGLAAALSVTTRSN